MKQHDDDATIANAGLYAGSPGQAGRSPNRGARRNLLLWKLTSRAELCLFHKKMSLISFGVILVSAKMKRDQHRNQESTIINEPRRSEHTPRKGWIEIDIVELLLDC